MTGLLSNTAYTFDVKARNEAGVETDFGPSVTISTLENFDPNLVLTSAAPSFGNVCTVGANNTTTTSFTLNGFYLDAADFSVASTSGELTFSETENGTYANPLTLAHASPTMTGQTVWVKFSPIATGAFTGTIAITGGGLASAFDVTATGIAVNTPATVTTGAVSDITVVGATIAGSATAGCSAIIASGIEYSTASDFTGATQVAAAFPVILNTLSPNTLYYVRAFAADSSELGGVYGSTTSFTTLALTTGPVADPATSLEATSFVANWQAVTGAESYLLDVSTNPDFVGAITTIANWSFPLATDNNIIDAGIAANTSNTLTTVGGVGTITYVPVSSSATSAASGAGWDAGNGTKYWQIDIATTGYSDLKLSSAQRSSGTGPRDFKVQYSVNAGANWFDVSGASVTVGNNWTTGVLSDIALPVACDNQPSVRLRWIMTSNTNVSAATVAGTGTSGIDNIIVTGRPPSFSVHEGLSVNGLSQFVSGLSELTTYYYRVRAFSTNSTSPNSNVISATTAAAPPTFDSVSYIGSTVCDGANGTFDVAGLIPNAASKIYYNINGGATESVLTTVADVSGGATFTIPLPLSANNTILTITTVARADDSSSLTVESGGQVYIDFIAANVTYYSDADSDTFGDAAVTQVSCTGAPSGFVANNTDCDPADGTKWQMATFYVDADADGYDNGSASVCSGLGAPAGYSASTSGTDCNDSNAALTVTYPYYTDADLDTYGAVGSAVTQLCTVNASSPTSGYSVTNDDCDDSNPTLNPTNPCPTNSIVNLTMFVQGYYDSASTMRSVKLNQDLGFPQTASATEVEDLTIELHDSVTYAMLYSTTATLNTDGTLSASFSGAPSGSFYIAVKGSNLVQTWSAEPQAVGTTPLSYDFTTSSSQAYGDNMLEVEPGVWAFFSGDLNQDNTIDNTDSDALLADVAISNFGPLATDVNGDGSVDNSDTDLFFPNLENSVFASFPE
ncbi:MAG: hypothetical protein IPP30_05795 [Flavobacterium sp.]|nr:hypothetical protein [Flavobacterium sp.]